MFHFSDPMKRIAWTLCVLGVLVAKDALSVDRLNAESEKLLSMVAALAAKDPFSLAGIEQATGVSFTTDSWHSFAMADQEHGIPRNSPLKEVEYRHPADTNLANRGITDLTIRDDICLPIGDVAAHFRKEWGIPGAAVDDVDNRERPLVYVYSFKDRKFKLYFSVPYHDQHGCVHEIWFNGDPDQLRLDR